MTKRYGKEGIILLASPRGPQSRAPQMQLKSGRASQRGGAAGADLYSGIEFKLRRRTAEGRR